MNNGAQTCLRIAVSLPVKGSFFYRVPKNLAPRAHVGCRVMVPFRNRKITGYILEKTTQDDEQVLKEISDVLDPEPLFHKQLIPLFEWMADYYIHPIGQIIQAALPGGLNMNPYKTAFLTEKGSNIFDSLPLRSEERKILSWIKDQPEKRIPWPLKKIYGLQKRDG